MSSYEHTETEGKNGRSAKYSRTEISKIASGHILSDNRERELGQRKYEKYGNGRYVTPGSKDRLLGKYPSFPVENISESDMRSYLGGYYVKGNSNLMIYVDGKIPNFIEKRELLVAAGYEPSEEITDEKIQKAINNLLAKIGYIDSQNENIDFDKLPKSVQNNIYYNEGYKLGQIKKKSRR